MANTTTLKDLRDRALDYADMTGSSFPVVARVNDYVNTALSELHDLLVNTHEDYFRKSQTVTLVAGTETYALPDDFYKTLRVFYVTSNRRYRVQRFDLDSIDGYRTSPIGSGTVHHWYVPQLTKLENDSDPVSIAVPVGWEDYVALCAAVRLLIREESDPSALMSERDRQQARISASAEPRDSGEPDSISDHYDRFDLGRQLLRTSERWFKYRLLGNNIHFIEVEYLGA